MPILDPSRRSQPQRAPEGTTSDRFKLSLLSTLFINIVAVLGAVPVWANATENLPAALATDESALSLTAGEPAPTSIVAESAIEAQPSATVQPEMTAAPTLEIAPVLPLTSSPAGSPGSQNISKKAQDLLGTGISQTVSQAESQPSTNPSAAPETAANQPVNNPLLPPPGWQFTFEPYLFVPLSVTGDIFFGRGRNLLFPNRPGVILPNSGVNLNLNKNFSDLTANLTNIFGVSGRVQAWNGNFGVVADGLYLNAGFNNSSNSSSLTLRNETDVTIPGFNIDTQSTLASFSLAAAYRIVTVPFRTITEPANPSNYYPAISFEALAGARYVSVFQSVDFDRGADFELFGSGVNPMLGGKVSLLLSKNLALYFRGDTSNLGGGDLKQFYNLYAGIDWKFSNSFALNLAYRNTQIEYVKQGPFNGDNGLNLRLQGVQLGISWRF